MNRRALQFLEPEQASLRGTGLLQDAQQVKVGSGSPAFPGWPKAVRHRTSIAYLSRDGGQRNPVERQDTNNAVVVHFI